MAWLQEAKNCDDGVIINIFVYSVDVSETCWDVLERNCWTDFHNIIRGYFVKHLLCLGAHEAFLSA